MAKLKKSAKKSSAGSAGAQAQAERLSKTLSESAQQIWLAGVGAFSRAQAEGGKLFEALVKEGMTLEQTARKIAGGQSSGNGGVTLPVGPGGHYFADAYINGRRIGVSLVFGAG